MLNEVILSTTRKSTVRLVQNFRTRTRERPVGFDLASWLHVCHLTVWRTSSSADGGEGRRILNDKYLFLCRKSSTIKSHWQRQKSNKDSGAAAGAKTQTTQNLQRPRTDICKSTENQRPFTGRFKIKLYELYVSIMSVSVLKSRKFLFFQIGILVSQGGRFFRPFDTVWVKSTL